MVAGVTQWVLLLLLSAGYDGGWGYSVGCCCCCLQATVVAGVTQWVVLLLSAGYGGGWGYSGHSVDVLLGGFALFGGRGEYFAKIRVR